MHYALTVVLLINVKSQLCSQLDDSVLAAVINYVISVLHNYCAPLHKLQNVLLLLTGMSCLKFG